MPKAPGLKSMMSRSLWSALRSLPKSKGIFEVKDALDEVEATGYGILMPEIEDLKLEEPEIMKQGGHYGVRLRASTPSIHP
ncbi:MAG: stage IV sporulation protein A [Oscillospiraceae bacterium]